MIDEKVMNTLNKGLMEKNPGDSSRKKVFFCRGCPGERVFSGGFEIKRHCVEVHCIPVPGWKEYKC